MIEDPDQNKLETRVRKICENFWTSLSIGSITLTEDLVQKESHISCTVNLTHRVKSSINIKGSGKGIVDALYSALVRELGKRYISLQGIKFDEFEIRAAIDDTKTPGSDAACAAKLSVVNARNRRYTFTAEEFSMNAAAITVVKKTIEFFVNAEIAAVKTHQSYKDAMQRQRADLVEKYTLQLAELVNVTCYEDLIRKIKSQSND